MSKVKIALSQDVKGLPYLCFIGFSMASTSAPQGTPGGFVSQTTLLGTFFGLELSNKKEPLIINQNANQGGGWSC